MKVNLIIALLIAGTINSMSYSAAAAAAAGTAEVKRAQEETKYIIENHSGKPVVVIKEYGWPDKFSKLSPAGLLAIDRITTIDDEEKDRIPLIRLWVFDQARYDAIRADPLNIEWSISLSKVAHPSFDFSKANALIPILLSAGKAKLVVNKGPILKIYLTEAGKTEITNPTFQEMIRQLGIKYIPSPVATDTTLAAPARDIPLPAAGDIIIDTTAPAAPAK